MPFYIIGNNMVRREHVREWHVRERHAPRRQRDVAAARRNASGA